MPGELILVSKQNQISWKLADWGKTLHAQTRGSGLYRVALDSEILLLPLKKVVQAQLYNLRNSQVAESLLSLLPQWEVYLRLWDLGNIQMCWIPIMADWWCSFSPGTSVIKVTATDADDPTYGNSARLVYSILQGQPYFSVEPQTGTVINNDIFTGSVLVLWSQPCIQKCIMCNFKSCLASIQLPQYEDWEWRG